MGVSFKVDKTGRRYRPKFYQLSDVILDNDDEGLNPKAASPIQSIDVDGVHDSLNACPIPLSPFGAKQVSPEREVSFALILFPHGFTIQKADEGLLRHLPQDSQKPLHPYNRESETLFSAIENGWLPGDLFDDLPCKYFNGTIICEIQDYRHKIPLDNKFPSIQKVCLQMSMENVVKDMSSISDESWTYGDLLEVESRITRALQPALFLDPKPSLARLSKMPILEKLKLRSHARQSRRHTHLSTVEVISDSMASRQKDFTTGAVKNSNSRIFAMPAVTNCTGSSDKHYIPPEGLRQPLLMGCHANLQPVSYSGSTPATGACLPSLVTCPKQNLTACYRTQRNPCIGPLGKRGEVEAHTISVPVLKRPKLEAIDHAYPNSGKNTGSRVEFDLHHKETQTEQYLESQSVQSARLGTQKYTRGQMDQYLAPSQQNSLAQQLEGTSHGRKASQSPQVSVGRPAISPTSSSKSGEVSTNSLAAPCSSGPQTCLIGSNREKATVSSSQSSGNTGSLSRENQVLLQTYNPLSLENQVFPCADSKPNSLPKTLSMSRAGSPLTAGNLNVHAGCNISSVVTPPVPPPSGSKCDPAMLDKFLKIDALVQRYDLNYESKKPDKSLDKKVMQHSPHLLALQLSQAIKEFKDAKMPMSNSLFCGNTDVGKSWTLLFENLDSRQAGSPSLECRALCKLVMAKKPKECNIETYVLYGNEESSHAGFSCLFANARHADWFASQFAALTVRDGYKLRDDHMQPLQCCTSELSGRLDHASALSVKEGADQSLNPGVISTQKQVSTNLLSRNQAIPNSNLPALQLPVGFPVQPQKLNPMIHQIQRSVPLATNNSACTTNLLASNQTVGNNALLQYQLQQQCQQQNVQLPQQGKMMVGGVGPVSMANMHTGLPGSPQVRNMVNMGNLRGAMSMPLSLSVINPMTNIGSQGSSFGLNVQMHGGALQAQAAALARMRLVQNYGRGMINAGSIWSPIEGSRKTPNGTILNQSAMRGAAFPVQPAAAAMAPMHPSKVNHMINQQLLQQHQLHQQAPRLDMGSPIQYWPGGAFPEQVGSPASHVSSQHMSQQGPINSQQMSSDMGPGSSQQISQPLNASTGVGPGSPQLSSQTHGSVGSITNSPMELQGVGKGGSVSNAGVRGA